MRPYYSQNFTINSVGFLRAYQRDAKRRNRKVGTIYFLGFTHYCTRNRKGNCMVGRKTEKTRLKRSMEKLREQMRSIRHNSLKNQAHEINQMLRGHYAYYGLGGNFKLLWKVHNFVERYWHNMLSSRSQKSYIPWQKFSVIKERYPLQQPKLKISFARIKEYAVL